MKILNKTKNTILAEDAIEAASWREKVNGLLLYDTPRTIIFRTHFGIHTFGMKYPIDAIVLNKQKQVVALKKHLKPNRIFLWNPKYSFVIELPTGSIEKSKTHLRDTITLS